MNYLQFTAFFIYVGAVLVAGTACYQFLNPPNHKNRSLYLGEVLLLGSILIIGQMLLLSMSSLYRGPYLWAAVLLNFSFLFYPRVRKAWGILFKKPAWDLPLIAFIVLIAVFIFRNMFFLVDVDSHSTYLYAQQLWLTHETSLFASPALDMKVFVPHFNAVPYALGLALFPHEPLFPQLIVALWTVITVLLVFGYVSSKISRTYALAAAMLCLFNDHMFYSGANNCCIINSALVALLFASAYNFWEAKAHNDPFRFVLALIFIPPLIANKYQAILVFMFLLILGFGIQGNLRKILTSILKNPRWLWAIGLSLMISAWWYLKNLLVTGSPFFPAFGDKLGWTQEMASSFNKIFAGPLSLSQIIKFLSFLFIWPGINAAKIVWVTITFFPLLVMFALSKPGFDKKFLQELCFWIGLSLLTIIGLCLLSFVDPRVYRYGIAVMAVAAVFSLEFILRHCLSLPPKIALVVILIIAAQGWKIMLMQEGASKYPTIKQNLEVLTNKLHMADLMPVYYPDNLVVNNEYAKNPERFKYAAWDSGVGGVTSLSAYFLPIRPQVGLWYTTAVDWKSYQNTQAIMNDLKKQNIEWVMRVQSGKLEFESAAAYAQRASLFDLHPKELFYNYGFPEELSRIK